MKAIRKLAGKRVVVRRRVASMSARSQRRDFTAHPHRVSTRRRCVAILKNRSVVMSVCGNRWGTVVNVVRLVRKICHKWVNISCIEAARSNGRTVLIYIPAIGT